LNFPGFHFRPCMVLIVFVSHAAQNERCTFDMHDRHCEIESQSAETFLARRKCITTEQDRRNCGSEWFFEMQYLYTHQELGALSPCCESLCHQNLISLKMNRLKVLAFRPNPFGGIDSDPRHIPLFMQEMATRSRGSRLTLRQNDLLRLVAQPQTND